MLTQLISADRFVAGLKSSILRRDAVLLIGAGVSVPHPTALPSGPALKDQMLREVAAEPFLTPYVQMIRGTESYQTLVPEELFERVHEIVGKRLMSFFRVLNSAQPNSVHAAIANLGRTAKIRIFTTNFDCLIERCGISRRGVVHLHGNVDQPTELVVRLNSVGRGLSPELRRSFHRATLGRTLFILGYSGTDKDVRDMLARCDARQIYWLTRSRHGRAWRNVLRIGGRDRVCRVAVADVAEIMTKVDTSAHSLAVPVRRNTAGPRRPWGRGLRSAERFACVSKILLDLEMYREANDVARKGGVLASREGWGAWFRNQQSAAAGLSGDLRGWRRFARQAERLAIQEGNPYEHAHALNAIGRSYLEGRVPAPRASISYFSRAIALMETIGAKRRDPYRREQAELSLAQFHNNRGLAFDHLRAFRDARREYLKSLEIKKRHGAILGISLTTANLCLLHSAAGDQKASSRWLLRARAMVSEFASLRFREAYLWRRLGEIAIDQVGMVQRTAV